MVLLPTQRRPSLLSLGIVTAQNVRNLQVRFISVCFAYRHSLMPRQPSPGGPFVATLHFPIDAVTISATPDSALHAYSPPLSPRETRYRCDICGVGVCSVTYRQMHTAVWGATLTRSPVQDGEDGTYRIAMWEQISPVLHYNYGARTLDVRDGLSKYRGDPLECIGAPGSQAQLAGGGDMEETEKASNSEGDGELDTEGETQRVEGACFCGQISYTFPADSVVRSVYCHCTQCQKLSGENSDIAPH